MYDIEIFNSYTLRMMNFLFAAKFFDNDLVEFIPGGSHRFHG